MANKNLNIRQTKAPNLPIGPVDYSQKYQDQLTNVLRLYFTEVDNFSAALASTDGGRFLQFPHIGAENVTTQYATGNDVPTTVKWSLADSISGFTLNLDNSATAVHSGIYKIDYSLQMANSANTQEDVFVWISVNGVAVPGSASKFTLVSRKSAGVFSYIVAYSSLEFAMNGGDSVKLIWATSLAATSGGGLGVFIENIPASTTPYVRPSSPSAVGSITFVSRLPA